MISSAFPDFNSPETLAYGTKITEWVKSHHAELGMQSIIYRHASGTANVQAAAGV